MLLPGVGSLVVEVRINRAVGARSVGLFHFAGGACHGLLKAEVWGAAALTDLD